VERCLACDVVVSKVHRDIAAWSCCALQFCDRRDPVERDAGRCCWQSTSQIRALQSVAKGSRYAGTVIALLATASQARQRSTGGAPSYLFARRNLPQESGRFLFGQAQVLRMTNTVVTDFTVRGLSPELFQGLFELADEELVKQRARRLVADSKPGFPCRVSLQDAEPGEEVILTNFVHLPGESPFHSTHAVYIRKKATIPVTYRNSLPEMLRSRLLSIRAFDGNDMLISADVIEGHRAEEVIVKFFENPVVLFLHVHFAKPGCYACRIDRA
jgi:hypothetical protein